MDAVSGTDLLDYFFKTFLLLSNFAFLGPLLIFGIYCVDRKAFLNVMIVCFLTAFINIFLKSIWQTPLDPSLGHQGWAFPSGHTQFNLVLWLMLIYQIRKLWIALIAIIISITSYFGMVHFHYHDWYDIYGGIFFGILTFLLFVLWDYFFKNRQLALSIAGFIISLLVLIILPSQPHNYLWLFMYLGMYTGTILYLLLERFKCFTITSKLSGRRLAELLLALAFMYAINLPNSDSQAIAYLKGLALTTMGLLVIPYLAKTPLLRKNS